TAVSLCQLSTPPAPSALDTLPLHDALPICRSEHPVAGNDKRQGIGSARLADGARRRAELAGQLAVTSRAACSDHGDLSPDAKLRSEEHTSELQSLTNLVCRLLLHKKKQNRL